MSKEKKKKKVSFWDTWAGSALVSVVAVLLGATFVFIVFSAGRSSKAAEITRDSQEFKYTNFYSDKMHYICFYTTMGGMTVVNFTLDSMKREYYKPTPIDIQIMPTDTITFKP